MFRRLIVGTILSSALLFAQDGDSATILPAPFPGQGVPNKEVREYLTLTDQQYTALEAIQRRRFEAEAQRWRVIAEKEAALYELLRAGSTDALRIGQLMIEIQTLRKQISDTPINSKEEALRVLNPQQIAKLPALNTALQLQSPAWQAVGLSLLDSPNRGDGVIPLISSGRSIGAPALVAPMPIGTSPVVPMPIPPFAAERSAH